MSSATMAAECDRSGLPPTDFAVPLSFLLFFVFSCHLSSNLFWHRSWANFIYVFLKSYGIFMHIILKDSKLNIFSCPFKERQLTLDGMLISQIFVFTLVL